MDQIDSGSHSMHDGLGMMPSEMRQHCGEGTSGAMGKVAEGMTSMEGGFRMMFDDTATNDEDGANEMQSGTDTAEQGVSAMGDSMSCMSHCRENGMMM